MEPFAIRDHLPPATGVAWEHLVFAQDPNGVIVCWSRGVEEILGYREADFVGRHISTIFTPDDVADGVVEDEMLEAAALGRTESTRCLVTSDGSCLRVTSMLTPLNGRDGGLRGFVRVLVNNAPICSEQDELLTPQVPQASPAASPSPCRMVRRAKLAEDEFLSMFAHELRNPLSAILGWVKLLKEHRLDEQRAAHALTIIEANAEAQSRLIEDVFDLARIRSGNLRLDARPMALDAAVRESVDSMRPAALAKQISLETKFPEEPITILGDWGRIEQIVTNILSNAVKFTQAGGHILVTLEKVEAGARVTVADNGPGISPSLFPHLFERYAQADKRSTRGKSGLGLGLPLVHELVKQHGGSVTAESAREGLGATFVILLPLAEPHSA
jgi:PAS domain S-box-containing protein